MEAGACYKMLQIVTLSQCVTQFYDMNNSFNYCDKCRSNGAGRDIGLAVLGM